MASPEFPRAFLDWCWLKIEHWEKLLVQSTLNSMLPVGALDAVESRLVAGLGVGKPGGLRAGRCLVEWVGITGVD